MSSSNNSSNTPSSKSSITTAKTAPPAVTTKKIRKFSFPYENPYDIQQQYMEQLFDTIQSGKVGIFESPTGSGKSLSLICGALTWLYSYYAERDGNNTNDDFESVNSTLQSNKRKLIGDNDDEEPSWVTEQTLKRKKDEEETERRERLEKSKKNVSKYDERRKQFLTETITETDDDLLLNEVNVLEKIGISNDLLKDLYDEDDSDEDERPIFSTNFVKKVVEDDNFETPKIIYCSRTHSQLNQFIQELRRTEFSKKIRVSNIASRQVLCNNEDVLYRKTKNGSQQNSLNSINEKCQYLRDKKACSFDNDPSLFKDHMTVKVHDIEELLDLGKKLKICSYYGTRKALPNSELICMPYNSLIHEQTRKSLGISTLKDCVVIIDEAHNLINAIHQMHSVELDISQLNLVKETLDSYFTKFKNRLSSTNQTNIIRLLTIVDNLVTYLKTVKKPSLLSNTTTTTTTNESVGNNNNNSEAIGFIVSITDLVFETKLDNINLFDIAEFIEKSDLTKKLNMFMERQDASSGNKENQVTIHNHKTVKRGGYVSNYVHYSANKSSSTDISKIITPSTSNNAVNSFVSMLLALMNVDKDGRIFVRPQSGIKFLLLNPSVYFQSILKEAKSVILTGGTMEPIGQLVQQMFPKTESSKIHIYQCEKHIVPANHFLPIALSKGIDNIPLDFTFKNRHKNDELMKCLGKIIVNLSSTVPDGIVLFFPSYQYEKTVFEYWKNNGIINLMEKKKKFLREASITEEPNNSLDKILQEYKKIIDHNFSTALNSTGAGGGGGVLQRYNGSILSCVVGGKLSEGINFSDGYGRLIVVVGLPYPNPNDPELLEQQSFFEKTTKLNKGEYLDNLCMNGVNQSIGRAIRHSKDYATVLLLDKRYHQTRLTGKLSKWIRKGLQTHDSFGKSSTLIEQFFKEKSKDQLEIEKQRKDRWTKSTKQ